MPTCKKPHRYDPSFDDLPEDQTESRGRHTCAACAYEMGFEAGVSQDLVPAFYFELLPTSQAGTVRHKSPLAAWALGYRDGVQESYAK